MRKTRSQTVTAARAKGRDTLAPIEGAARAGGAIVCRQHRVVTPAVDAVVELLVVHGLCRTVYEARFSLDCLGWIIRKATALKPDELRIIFPNERLARAAQQLADQLTASRCRTPLPVLCLTTSEALRLFPRVNHSASPSSTTKPTNQQESVS